MIRAARSLPALLSTAFALAFAAGCHSHDDVGKPCDNAEQCAEGQICDFHDGKGTCQEPHGHGTEAAATDDHATDDHATDDHEHTGTDPTETSGGTTHGETEHGETEHGETEHEHTSTAGTTDTSTG